MSSSTSGTLFGWDTTAFRTDEHVIISEYLLLFSFLLLVCLVLQHYWSKLWKISFIPEAGVTIAVGILVSFMIFISGGFNIEDKINRTVQEYNDNDENSEGVAAGLKILCFSPTIFFFGFLPPIIYNSGSVTMTFLLHTCDDVKSWLVQLDVGIISNALCSMTI